MRQNRRTQNRSGASSRIDEFQTFAGGLKRLNEFFTDGEPLRAYDIQWMESAFMHSLEFASLSAAWATSWQSHFLQFSGSFWSFAVEGNGSEHSDWSTTQDSLLVRLAIKHSQDWRQILPSFPGKSTRDLRRRYFEVRYSLPFTAEETQTIKSFYAKNGPSWKTISEVLKTHLPHQIKYHFYQVILPKLGTEQVKSLSKKEGGKKYGNSLDVTVIYDNFMPSQTEDRSTLDTEIASQPSISTNLNAKVDNEYKRRKIQELYKKIGALQAFISKTEDDLSILKTDV